MAYTEGIKTHKNKLRLVPVAITVLMVVLCGVFLYNHDFKDILNYTPDNLFLAFLAILAMYALKSMSIVFPLTALFIAAGLLYPFAVAVIINTIGLCISFTVPYLAGRVSGGDFVDSVSQRFPKAEKMVNYSHDNNLFASYISRAVVVVPGDLVSMIHGALKMPYKPYLLGSVLGVMPEMLVQTYIGGQLNDLTFKSVMVMIALIAVTLAFSVIFNKRISRRRTEQDL